MVRPESRSAPRPAQIIRNRLRARRGVVRIVSGNDLQQHRTIARGASERPDMIHAPRARHRAVAAHAPIGRLQPGNAVVGRGQPDRGAGIGPERTEYGARRNRNRRAARRAAGDMRRVERVAAVPEMDVVPGRTGGKFRHVEDADLDRARRVEPLQHGGGGRLRPGPAGSCFRRWRPCRRGRTCPCGRAARHAADRGGARA